LRSKQPEGPLDRPTFPNDQTPKGFWLESAETLFRSSREIVDIIGLCQEKNKLPQSTIVVFAVWTATFNGLYAAHYPQMDVQKHLTSFSWNESKPGKRYQRGATGLAYQTLINMSTSLEMAATYAGVVRYMDDYLWKVKEDFEKHGGRNSPSPEGRDVSVRHGGNGGGIEEWHHMSKKLQDFGTLHPSDHYNHGSQQHDAEHGDGQDRQRPGSSAPSSTSFTAINQATLAPSSSERSPLQQHNHEPAPRAQDRLSPILNTASFRTRQAQDRSPLSDAVHGNKVPSPLGTTSIIPQFELNQEESKRFGDTNDLEILTQNDDNCTWLRPFDMTPQHHNFLHRSPQPVITIS
jgi:hypothetical protein